MSEGASETAAVSCPMCKSPAERGCVMSGSGHWMRWFAGPPGFWKRITAGAFVSSPGQPVGDMGELCGSYVEGIRCRACERIVLEAVDPDKRKR
jgi:hypothetical protein